jgi:alpha-L-fucosidase 2
MQPATRWEEALPIGNGRLGAMVFGRIAQERLQLNEDSLWAGSPYNPDNPDALEALPEVRRLIALGRYKEAEELASAKMMARPLRQMPYGTMGDLLLDFHSAEIPSGFERTLDLETAIASLEYRTRRGWFRREAFASAPDQVIVLRMQATGSERLALTVAHRAPRAVRYTAANYQGSATDLLAPTQIDWLVREETGESGKTLVIPDGDGSLLITGRNEDAENIRGGLAYAIKLQLLGDGNRKTEGATLKLDGGREAILLIAAATSYRSHRDTSADPVAKVRDTMARAAATSYARLKRDHVQDYRSFYNRMSIDLGSTPASALPTDKRIAASESNHDPALHALYLQFGRYLMISSSRPGTQPANLQGLWNEGVNPPWGSKYTININTEMNYWPADPTGLGICVEPLLRMVEELAQTGARTARTMYGARGWVAHHNTDLWRAAAPIDGPQWGLWPCGGAWLCNALWDHFDHDRGEALLRRLYPLLEGASLFFIDTLVEDPKGRGLITSPSLSPENPHPFGASLCAGPAMDRQIIRDLFGNLLEAARLLGVDAPLLGQVRTARGRLAPDRINKSGLLQEWLEDWDEEAPEQDHRHVSHLYAVYPSSQINLRDTPELAAAARKSLDRRGDFATGWGTAWRLCLWARMGDAERAYSVLRGLTGPRRTYPNLFDAHPPFQIDGNFGGAAGILEMLLQSWGGELILLPALPRAWPSGMVKGVRARGGLVVDLEWRSAKVFSLLVKGPANSTVRIREDGEVRQVSLGSKGIYRYQT